MKGNGVYTYVAPGPDNADTVVVEKKLLPFLNYAERKFAPDQYETTRSGHH